MGENEGDTKVPLASIDQAADPAPYIDPLYAG